MRDIERLNIRIYSIVLTKDKKGFDKYLEFISGVNGKFSKYAIKINLRINCIYRSEYKYKKPYELIYKLFRSKKICCGFFFKKEIEYSGYLDFFYVYDFDHAVAKNRIYRLKYMGIYANNLPNNVNKEYFEKEAEKYQKHDIYFILENDLFVFNNAAYGYSDEKIDSILGRLEFVDFVFSGKKERGLFERLLTLRKKNESKGNGKKDKLLQKSENINKMSGMEFEQFCKDILVNYGWFVNTTKTSGDHGIDIIAKKNGKNIGIQCKNYTNKMVNNRAIQEVYTGCHFYDLSIPVIVTNISFTKQAIQEANKLNIKLFDIKQFFCFASE
jgi:HJR/Mrr/RecB family endonuclease